MLQLNYPLYLSLSHINIWYRICGHYFKAFIWVNHKTFLIFNFILFHIFLYGKRFHSGYGQTNLPSSHPPLALKNVLHAPKLIKNLVSVRKFTTDNFVTVEFDPFGFSVKDFQTGMPLMRCESRGALYPITESTTPATSSSTFVALAPSL